MKHFHFSCIKIYKLISCWAKDEWHSILLIFHEVILRRRIGSCFIVSVLSSTCTQKHYVITKALRVLKCVNEIPIFIQILLEYCFLLWKSFTCTYHFALNYSNREAEGRNTCRGREVLEEKLVQLNFIQNLKVKETKTILKASMKIRWHESS